MLVLIEVVSKAETHMPVCCDTVNLATVASLLSPFCSNKTYHFDLSRGCHNRPNTGKKSVLDDFICIL